jgi:hypothetical protein
MFNFYLVLVIFLVVIFLLYQSCYSSYFINQPITPNIPNCIYDTNNGILSCTSATNGYGLYVAGPNDDTSDNEAVDWRYSPNVPLVPDYGTLNPMF